MQTEPFTTDHIPTPPEDTALYNACKAFLTGRHTVLWSDFDLTRNKDKAARWLADQIRGVAEHFTASATAPPFLPAGQLTDPPAYAGPYSVEDRSRPVQYEQEGYEALRRKDGPV